MGRWPWYRRVRFRGWGLGLCSGSSLHLILPWQESLVKLLEGRLREVYWKSPSPIRYRRILASVQGLLDPSVRLPSSASDALLLDALAPAGGLRVAHVGALLLLAPSAPAQDGASTGTSAPAHQWRL